MKILRNLGRNVTNFTRGAAQGSPRGLALREQILRRKMAQAASDQETENRKAQMALLLAKMGIDPTTGMNPEGSISTPTLVDIARRVREQQDEPVAPSFLFKGSDGRPVMQRGDETYVDTPEGYEAPGVQVEWKPLPGVSGVLYDPNTGNSKQITDTAPVIPKEFLAERERIVREVATGKRTPTEALAALERSAEARGVPYDVEADRDLLNSSAMKLDFGDGAIQKLGLAREIQLNMTDLIDRLQTKNVRDALGQIEGRRTRFFQWLDSGDGDSDSIVDPQIESFLTSLGLARDQIVRMRTGAAINESEDALFRAIIGSELQSPEQLESRFKATIDAMEKSREGLWQSSLEAKYQGAAPEYYDQIPRYESGSRYYEDVKNRMREIEDMMTAYGEVSDEEAQEYEDLKGWMTEKGWLSGED